MEEKDSNGEFITRQQFCKIIDLFNIYRQKHDEVFPNKPLSNEFRKGLIKGLELIETYMVIKDYDTKKNETILWKKI